MIRIASGAGFWGDYPDATTRLLETAEFDYLQLEYLAEVTMGLLGRLRASGHEGYATDFVDLVLNGSLDTLLDRDITVVTNAGGVAPETCAEDVASLAAEKGREPTIATVTGDDITSAIAGLRGANQLQHFETGELFPETVDPVTAAVYFGAAPIRDALQEGADIVVTGRVADPALTLGPLLYEFDWKLDDYDRLAAGTVGGHLIECGTQVTGGNYIGSWEELSFADIGYPIAEITPEGTVTITKPSGSGGTVTAGTVSEQLVYEIGDPAAYHTPDVTADFTSVTLTEVEEDAVEISNVEGSAPPDRYKATIHYQHDFKLAGQLLYSRPDALQKAKRAAEILKRRIDMLGLTIDETHADYVGHNATHGPMAPERDEYNEIMLRFTARGPSRHDLHQLGRQFAPLSMAGPPSVTGVTDGGRPSPKPIIDTWPTLVDRSVAEPEVIARE